MNKTNNYPIQYVDVFSKQAFYGNPLAVVANADNLTDAQMQQIANWFNLSETVFLLKPRWIDADYRARIFMANGKELPFAGHPTLGACHAWLQAGGIPKQVGKVTQECGVGLVELKQTEQGQWCFAAPLLKRTELELPRFNLLCRALGVKAQQVKASQLLDNGRSYYALLLKNAQSVLEAKPDLSTLAANQINVGIIGAYSESDSSALNPNFEVRYFNPAAGTNEDPITGNLNGALAQWLIETKYAPTQYVAAQGTLLGRAGRVYISCDEVAQQVWVGGDTHTCTQGILMI